MTNRESRISRGLGVYSWRLIPAPHSRRGHADWPLSVKDRPLSQTGWCQGQAAVTGAVSAADMPLSRMATQKVAAVTDGLCQGRALSKTGRCLHRLTSKVQAAEKSEHCISLNRSMQKIQCMSVILHCQCIFIEQRTGGDTCHMPTVLCVQLLTCIHELLLGAACRLQAACLPGK